jgi:hypothetical protein
MRLYGGQVPVIAEDLLRVLTRGDKIDVTDENMPEVELDIQSVLKEYIRLDRELTDAAREKLRRSNRSLGIGRVKRELAKKKNVQVGDEAIGYIINQLIEAFLHSNFVDEVYATDNDLRKTMKPILERHMSMDEELDREVRDKIKNIEEGSASWDVEYQKVMEKLKRTKNLE